MRHYSVCAIAALAAGIIFGCGPAKELPDEVPKTQGPDTTSGELKEIVPTVSDPAALEIVDQAIKAHTLNNPALLAKAKLSKVTANGSIKLNVPPSTEQVPVPSLRTFVSRWPNEFRLTHAFQSHIPGTMTMILRGSLTWWGLNGTANPVPDPQGFEEVMRTDGMAMHWLPLLFPIREPGAIVFEPKKGAGSPPADSVRLALPGRPVYTLFFDPKTHYLTRIEYLHADSAGRALKEWIVFDMKAFDGMMLPTQMKMARTPRSKSRDVVEEWAVEKWEFPEKFEDNAFEPPKS